MSELRSILADTVTRLLTDRVTKDVLETAEQGQWPAALWQALEESGLTLPLVTEKQGGAGGTWGDAHVLLAAAGRFGPPVPLAETIIASWLLSEAGLEVPLGPLTVAPVHRDIQLVGSFDEIEPVDGRDLPDPLVNRECFGQSFGSNHISPTSASRFNRSYTLEPLSRQGREEMLSFPLRP